VIKLITIRKPKEKLGLARALPGERIFPQGIVTHSKSIENAQKNFPDARGLIALLREREIHLRIDFDHDSNHLRGPPADSNHD
jgi:hypothetical protein